MVDNSNPAVPTCKGALLAEEWSIDPLSTLPSFLEMVMIADATRSARKALRSFADAAEVHLRSSSRGFNEPISSSEPAGYVRVFQILSDFRHRVARALHRFLRLYFSELVCLVIYYVEKRCLLSNAQATSSETIYGGTRVKLRRKPGSQGVMSLERMSDVDGTRLALILSTVPYLQEKLSRQYRRLSYNTGSGEVARWFVRLWPSICTVSELAQIGIRWRYLVGQSHSFDLPSLILGSIVRRRTLEDDSRTNAAGDETKSSGIETPPGPGPASQSTKVAATFLFASAILSVLTRIRAELIQSRQETRSVSDSPILQPPPKPSRAHLSSSANPEHCPICKEKRVNPAASPSGYVFCHRCLVSYVQKYGKCPVTGVPCTETNIVRLFEPFHETRHTT
mgnify:CR=1 FL=1